MITKKVLVLLNNVNNIAIVQAGIKRYCDKVFERTNGEFGIGLEYVDVSNHIFHTVQGNNSEGQNIAFVDFNEIISAGKDFTKDAICLIFNPTKTIGFMATNPGDQGVNFQIPTTWIGDIPGWDRSEYSAQYYFGHENSHSDFFLTAEADQTHNTAQQQKDHPQITLTDDPSDFYIDLLLTLKPHWAKLGQSMTQYQAKFVHVKDTSEYGVLEITPYTKIYHRAIAEQDLSYLLNKFEIKGVFKEDQTVDFTQAGDVEL